MTTQSTKEPVYGAVTSENVSYKGHNGETVSGYLSRPAATGRYPAVIVIHEVFGLVNHIRELTFKFAGHGYIALAPDLHHREGPGDPEDVAAKVRAVGGNPDARTVGDLEGAARYLKQLPTCNGKVGVIGFCSGGRQVVLFAANTKSLDAAVSCYGGRVVQTEFNDRQPKAPLDMVAGVACPVLSLSGTEDRNPSPEQVQRLAEEMRKHGKQFESHIYPNAGHAFFADYRPSYRQEAAVDGWRRVFEFFGKRLRSA